METIQTNVTVKLQNGTVWCNFYAPKDHETGKHPAIIMSHGYNGSGDNWEMEGKKYAELGAVCLAPDFRGASAKSRSSGKQTDMTISSECEDLKAVLSYVRGLPYVDTEHIYLIGASQGGLISAMVAEEEKDKIRKLFLYFPALCIADNWKEKFPVPEEAPEVIEFWDNKVGKGFVLDLVQYRGQSERWGAYEGPIHVFHGDKDPIVPYTYSQDYVTHFQNAELTVYPGEGHGFSEPVHSQIMDIMKNEMELCINA